MLCSVLVYDVDHEYAVLCRMKRTAQYYRVGSPCSALCMPPSALGSRGVSCCACGLDYGTCLCPCHTLLGAYRAFCNPLPCALPHHTCSLWNNFGQKRVPLCVYLTPLVLDHVPGVYFGFKCLEVCVRAWNWIVWIVSPMSASCRAVQFLRTSHFHIQPENIILQDDV